MKRHEALKDTGICMTEKLTDLLNGYPIVNLLGTFERDIESIAYDSRKVEAGGLFVALAGTREDGARYIPEALRRKAAAFITQSSPQQLLEFGVGVNGVTQIHVKDARDALSWISTRYYHQPSQDLNLVGITGTNGKTTLTFLLESVFQQAGKSCGVIGSINYRFADTVCPANVTTPESLDLNRILADMVAAKIENCFLEVSSHSLAQKRVHGLHFDMAVFTNLTRDHLDYHSDLHNYRETKMSLFRTERVGKQVINLDDPLGPKIVAETSRPTLTVGIDSKADIRAESIDLSAQGVRFRLTGPYGSREIRSPLLGRHNILNLLSAAAVGLFQGLSMDRVCSGLENLTEVPGRLEKIENTRGITVAVDFAHTDDALYNALLAVRGFTRGRVLVVFGCGGDRDRTKRGPMGKIAVDNSELAIVTSDNPRTEDPLNIIEDIRLGLPEKAEEGRDFLVIPDRRQAIEKALELAREGDTVLIAGKGAEDYQIIGTEKIHFDDREVVRSLLNG